MGDIIQELEEKFQHHFERARSFLKEEDFISAREEVEKALEVKPGDDRALNLLGMIYFKIEDYEKAVKIFRQLLRRNPNINTLRINLGLAYLKLEEYEEATQILKEAVILDDQNEKAHNYLGYALYNLGKLEEALEEFKKGKAEKMVKKLEAELRGESEAKVEEKPESVEELPTPQEEITPQQIPHDTGEKIEEETIENFKPLVDEKEEKSLAEEQILSENSKEAEEDTLPSRESLQEEKVPAEKEKRIEHSMESTPEEGGEEAVGREDKAEQEKESTTVAKSPEPEFEKEEYSERRISEEREVSQLQEKEGVTKGAAGAEIKKIHSFKQGNIIINLVDEKFFVRSKDVLLVKGDINFTDIKKKYGGKELQAIFGSSKDPMSIVSGMGHISVEAVNGEEPFEVEIRGEVLFLIEKYILGFSENLEYENGKLKGQHTEIDMVKFTKHGYVILRAPRKSVISVETVSPDESMLVPLERIIGWKGRFIPKIPDSKKAFLSLKGEGYVYLKK